MYVIDFQVTQSWINAELIKESNEWECFMCLYFDAASMKYYYHRNGGWVSHMKMLTHGMFVGINVVW